MPTSTQPIANDAEHQAWRRRLYRILGMADDPAMDPEPVIDLDAIDLTEEPAEVSTGALARSR